MSSPTLTCLRGYGGNANCSVQVDLHCLYQGMCFSLTMFTNEWPNGVQQRTLVAVFDLRSTRSEEVQRTHLDHERLKLNDVASRTVQLQPECLWLEIRYAPEAIQLVSMTQSVKESYRKPCLIYCSFKFTFYHCVSWLHQSREGSFVPFVFFLLF